MSIEGEIDGEEVHFEGYFRDPALAVESPLAWALGQRQDLLGALRGLFAGPAPVVQLRLWCFLELASAPQGRIDHEWLRQAFHALKPQALDSVLKRLREAGLLRWDASAQDYRFSPLAGQLHGLLAPLTASSGENDDLAPLLAQVAGAQALGLADAGQLRHLHAQLARLHDEFADAIASGSEIQLHAAQPRFARAIALVERAGQALTALIRTEGGDARLEREARALGLAQARLLSMASQFNRAIQQADRQRVTLGSTGVTSSDVREWLKRQAALDTLLDGALAVAVRPVFVSQHDLLDVAEGELERDRPDPQRSTGLPEPRDAAAGQIEVPRMPPELQCLIEQLAQWRGGAVAGQTTTRRLDETVLGGRFAQAAYRLQLMPLLDDPQARTLKGQTGDLARAGWRCAFESAVAAVNDPHVAALSEGRIEATETPPDA